MNTCAWAITILGVAWVFLFIKIEDIFIARRAKKIEKEIENIEPMKEDLSWLLSYEEDGDRPY